METRLLALLSAAALAVVAAAPAAIVTTDQSNTTGGGYAMVAATKTTYDNFFGQSFTPTLASLNAATFSLYTGGTATLTLNVYSGAGFTGTPLGTSAPVTITNTSYQTIEFDLASPVLLTPGIVYTLGLTVAANSRSVYLGANLNNPYAGGSLYYSGSVASDYDAVFAEGLTTPLAGAPEPGTWATVGLGAGVLGLALHRRLAARA